MINNGTIHDTSQYEHPLDGIGILRTGDLVFGPYSNPHFRVNVTADDSDQVYVEGTVNILGDVHLDIDSDIQESGDDVLVLIENDGYESISGTFFDFELDFELEEGAMVAVGDAPYMITYYYNAEGGRSGTGNDVALVQPPNMTAHRPVHKGNGNYLPFASTEVAEADEESATLGPGIRINGDDDGISINENDFIEVKLWRPDTDTDFRLRRSSTNIKVWRDPFERPGGEITFPNAGGLETHDLPWLGQIKTVWVEWLGTAGHGTADLSLKKSGGAVHDTVKFHTFHSIIVFLGGMDQVPSDPPSEPNNFGTFVVAIDLYREGWDVWMYDEEAVASNGTGAPYNEIIKAYDDRHVTNVAVHGYSKGGGATYDLVGALYNSEHKIKVKYSGYVDAIMSATGWYSETRRPKKSLYHLNIYQTSGVIDGEPTVGLLPTDNEYCADDWTPGVTHLTIDDHAQTKSLIKTKLAEKLQNR